ncbi:MAG: YciI family protein [Vitreimonas sp.]
MQLPKLLCAPLVAIAIVVCAAGACASPADAQQNQVQMSQQLYLFQYSPGPAWREGAPLREQGLGPHAAYMQRLMNEGRLFAGGGYTSDDGGMAIVMAANMDEARAMLAADPAIASGIFVAQLRHWRPRFRTDDPLPAAQ